ncbi:hypothetical protein N7447_003524 [Penicillium robsamsonii]|uniref:uncharacterized protein n=1 Tax=Penicillium robsamsonii TaxID=1792511 RepID=UPI0025498154|nr:uncharacterized protein N7447_003524 [Penicillium robsamsonii]KAJ5826761.1 hypothetical protein N7447_003524 [Penicillium robsamsonii]
MQINRPSIFTLALILAVTQSTTSHPIQTSKWVKTEQYKDPNARGIWKVFEKEPYDLKPDPPHVKYNGVSPKSYIVDSATYLYTQNPAWPTNQNNEQTEQDTPNNRYATGTSESGKPTVSILIPASPGIPEPMHKHYSQHTGEKEHQSPKDESIDALAAQRQDHYRDILQYLHTKATLNKEHKHTTSAYSSHSLLGYSSSFFTYRFSLPTLRSKTLTFSHYPLPGVFPTVIILLVMVWVSIFTIGLLELGNYLWRRRGQASVGESDRVLESEECNVHVDETMKIPLRIIVAPLESTRLRSVGEHEYEFLETIYSDYESDSGSESDEDEYRMF